MIKRFDDWMSVVLVRRWMLVLLFAGGIGAWLLLPALMLAFGFLYFDGGFSWDELFRQDASLSVYYAGVVAVVYGLYRGAYFHPLLNIAYGDSLARTPWRYPAAMPLGPAHLVWQDAVVALILIVVAILPPAGLRYIHVVPTALLATHGYVQCFGLWRIDIRRSTHLITVLSGAVVVVIDRPILSLAIAILVFLFGQLAVRLTLQEFPYGFAQRRGLKLLPDAVPNNSAVAWLAAPMARLKWYHRIGPVDAILVGITVAWLILCFAINAPNDREMFGRLWVLHGYLATGAVVGRFLLYFLGHWPPISIAGRFATGRLIVPRYDVFLLAPLCAAVIAYAMPTLLIHRFGMSPLYALPLATATTIAIAFGLPPRWEDWHLRSHCRESLGVFSAAKYVKTS